MSRIDRTAVSVTDLSDDDSEREYWWSRTAEERMAAMELMRQITYEYDPIADRIPRILEILERGTS